MPSPSHEGIVYLFRAAPPLAVELLRRVTGWTPPADARAELTDATAGQVQPTERRADAAVVLRDAAGEACAAIVVEVQRQRDEDKRMRWPEYVAATQARLRVPCYLLVVTLDARVAAWARRPVPFGRPGYGFAPVVIGPSEVPGALAAEEVAELPELGVLAAHAHPSGEVARALVRALRPVLAPLSGKNEMIYWDMLNETLDPEVRRLLEALMPEGYQYQSEFARKYYDEGKLEGEQEGKREVARRLLAEGMAPADVARLTELPLAEVQSLTH